jgi:hypothetical protein
VGQSLAASNALSQQMAQLSDYEGQARAMARVGWVIGGAIALMCLPGFWFVGKFMLGMFSRPLGMKAFIMIIGTVPVALAIFVPLVAALLGRRKKRRQLAGLPTSHPVIYGDTLYSMCPHCGAPHDVPQLQLTATCGHCATEALLPLPLVNKRLTARHHKVTNIRLRQNIATTTATEAHQSSQFVLAVTFCILGVVGTIGMIIFYIMVL